MTRLVMIAQRVSRAGNKVDLAKAMKTAEASNALAYDNTEYHQSHALLQFRGYF